jgi:hypothetical protein
MKHIGKIKTAGRFAAVLLLLCHFSQMFRPGK